MPLTTAIGVLTDFSILRPQNTQPQDAMLDWLATAHARAEAVSRGQAAELEPTLHARVRKGYSRFGCDSSRIGTRHFEIGDAGQTDFERMQIYRIAPPTGDSGPYVEGAAGSGMLQRTRFFAKKALSAFEEFYPTAAQAPAHVVHVTCTGYCSPSAAQNLVDLRGWHGLTNVTHAYHMGCYASLPAIRMAMGLLVSADKPNREPACRQPGGHPLPARSSIDIVHTELCSLHLNLLDHSPEQMVVNSLFGDGYAKYTVAPLLDDARRPGLEVLGIREFLIPGSRECMAWTAADWGMQMVLARDVPQRIAGHLERFLMALLEEAGALDAAEREAIRREAIFAIHPGGPRIIDSIQELLALSEEQVRHSKRVLFENGNMSSATLPHVWSAVLADPTVAPGRIVVSLAFGPGLTIFGAVLRKQV